MKDMLSAVTRLLRRFSRRQDGTAAVEFALVVPVMLLLYVGTVEVTSMISLSRQVQKVSGSVGDLVSQSDSTIRTSQVTDYFTIARTMMGSEYVAGLKQAVTAVDVALDGKSVVAWSMQTGGAQVLSKGTTFKLPDAIVEISRGETVIVSESSATYQPMYGFVLDEPVTMERQSIYRLRFGGKIELK